MTAHNSSQYSLTMHVAAGLVLNLGGIDLSFKGNSLCLDGLGLGFSCLGISLSGPYLDHCCPSLRTGSLGLHGLGLCSLGLGGLGLGLVPDHSLGGLGLGLSLGVISFSLGCPGFGFLDNGCLGLGVLSLGCFDGLGLGLRGYDLCSFSLCSLGLSLGFGCGGIGLCCLCLGHGWFFSWYW